MKKFPILCAIVLAVARLSSPAAAGSATELSMEVNETFELKAIRTDRTAVPGVGVDQEWVDSWTSDGGGWYWYTPEKYDFVEGDTIECIIFYSQGVYWNLVLTNAFYSCGTTDWRNYFFTHTTDFGTLPPPPPDYGWIVGIPYLAPDINANIDWASQLAMSGYTLFAGSPLSGRPSCFAIETGDR